MSGLVGQGVDGESVAVKSFLLSQCPMRKRSIVLVFAILLLAVGLAFPVSAHWVAGATGKTGCSGLNMHDLGDRMINYERSNLTNGNHNAVEWVMLNRVQPTDLDTVPSTGAATDFLYYDSNYTTFCNKSWWSPSNPNGVIGLAKCDALKPDSACDRHTIYFSSTWTDQEEIGGRRRLACHETGHAIGFEHNDHAGTSLDSCMRTPLSDSNIYSTHEVDIINQFW